MNDTKNQFYTFVFLFFFLFYFKCFLNFRRLLAWAIFCLFSYEKNIFQVAIFNVDIKIIFVYQQQREKIFWFIFLVRVAKYIFIYFLGTFCRLLKIN